MHPPRESKGTDMVNRSIQPASCSHSTHAAAYMDWPTRRISSNADQDIAVLIQAFRKRPAQKYPNGRKGRRPQRNTTTEHQDPSQALPFQSVPRHASLNMPNQPAKPRDQTESKKQKEGQKQLLESDRPGLEPGTWRGCECLNQRHALPTTPPIHKRL
ncbi:hypothetical protein BC567DRAFT_228477 [Phyllosticta citribraziliensis]